MHARTHARTHECTHARTHARTRARTHAHTHTHTHTHSHTQYFPILSVEIITQSNAVVLKEKYTISEFCLRVTKPSPTSRDAILFNRRTFGIQLCARIFSLSRSPHVSLSLSCHTYKRGGGGASNIIYYSICPLYFWFWWYRSGISVFRLISFLRCCFRFPVSSHPHFVDVWRYSQRIPQRNPPWKRNSTPTPTFPHSIDLSCHLHTMCWHWQ